MEMLTNKIDEIITSLTVLGWVLFKVLSGMYFIQYNKKLFRLLNSSKQMQLL